MTREVLHLVTSLPGGVDGIRDYALGIASGMRRHGVSSSFLAAGGGGASPAPVCRLEGFEWITLPGRAPGELVRALERAGHRTLLLHHSGYGYARRGAPMWLVRGLGRWKAGGAGRRLVVMFHELWASGPIWRSSFWTSGLQRAVVARLLDLADVFMTSTETYARRLERLAPRRRPHACLPVFSNIGEAVPSAFESRASTAAVFGQPGTRRRVYASLADYRPILEANRIGRLIDIGPGDVIDGPPPPIPVVRRGYLGAADASRAIGACRLGLLTYPLDFLAKSGIFAAYAAHGVAPVIRTPVEGVFDGLQAGLNLIPAPASAAPPAAPIAAAAAAWYQGHTLERTSAVFAEAIGLAASP